MKMDAPDGAKLFCRKAGGAAPNDASKGGSSQSSPCSPYGLRVAPGCSGPRFAAFDALPPAFATWQGCKWDLHPAFN